MAQGWQTWQNYVTYGTRAEQPTGRPVPVGALYCVADEGNIIERWTGVSWTPYSPPANIVFTGRLTARTAAVANVVTANVGATDRSFEISANVNIVSVSSLTMQVVCTYRDENNAVRTLKFAFVRTNGNEFVLDIDKNGGTGPLASLVYHIRCKANTTIVISTTGAFGSVVYNVEGEIRRVN